MSLAFANYFDDWLHRGIGNALSDPPWYVYGIWVYRADKMTPTDLRKLAIGYVQRVSLTLRVPQLEGISLPTAL